MCCKNIAIHFLSCTFAAFKMDQETSKSVYFLRITIQVSFVGFLFYAIGYSLLSASVLLPAILTILVFLVLNAVIYFEYRKKMYKLAKYSILNLLVSTIFLIVFVFMGPEPGIQYFFLVFAMLPMILFSFKQALSWLFYTILNIGLFVWAEVFLEDAFMDVEVPGIVLLPIRITTIVITIAIICFALWVLHLANQRSEKELEEQAKALEKHIEEMKEQEVLLRKAIATKDKFSSIIAHDLRNPISNIAGFSQLLSNKYDTLESEKRRTYINTILEASTSADKLINSLVVWSRSQDGRIEIKKEPFKINEVFKQNLKLQHLAISKKGISVNSSCPDDLLAFADINMVDTIIRNLLSNSIKFSPKGGNISLSARLNGKVVQIEISDTGIGMNEEEQEKMFRIDQSFSTKGTEGEKGSGLGLVIVQDFILKNDGTITVKSKKNEGTTFIITLPRPQLNADEA